MGDESMNIKDLIDSLYNEKLMLIRFVNERGLQNELQEWMTEKIAELKYINDNNEEF